MIDSKMITDDNSNATELNRNFNLIEGRHTFRDGDGIGVGDSNELSNNFLKRDMYKVQEYLDSGITLKQIIDLDLALDLRMDKTEGHFRIV